MNILFSIGLEPISEVRIFLSYHNNHKNSHFFMNKKNNSHASQSSLSYTRNNMLLLVTSLIFIISHKNNMASVKLSGTWGKALTLWHYFWMLINPWPSESNFSSKRVKKHVIFAGKGPFCPPLRTSWIKLP